MLPVIAVPSAVTTIRKKPTMTHMTVTATSQPTYVLAYSLQSSSVVNDQYPQSSPHETLGPFAQSSSIHVQ